MRHLLYHISFATFETMLQDSLNLSKVDVKLLLSYFICPRIANEGI